MGCDIHTIVEVRDGSEKWQAQNLKPEIFPYRHYGLFGFLANVRNYSNVPNPWPPRGWPKDASEEAWDFFNYWLRCLHTHSHLYLHELLAFNYQKEFEDLRTTKEVAPGVFNGGATAEPGAGKIITYFDFLPGEFFYDFARLCQLGKPEDVRVLFFFDN